MRLEISQRILFRGSLAKLFDRELWPAVPAGNFNLHFQDVAGLEGLGAGLPVVPHPGFALAGAVAQPQ